MRRAVLCVVALLLVSAAAVEGLRAHLEEGGLLRTGLEGAVSSQLGARLEAGALRVSFWPARVRLAEPVLLLPDGGRMTLGETTVAVDAASLLRGDARLLAIESDAPAHVRHRRLELAGDLRARLAPAEAPLDWSLEARADLASGGRLSFRGGLAPGRRLTGTVELTEIESEPFAPFLTSAAGSRPKLSGRYSGTLELPAEGRRGATLRLASPDAVLDIPPVRLEGPIALVAELPVAEASDPSGGSFRIDATGADVEYAGGPAVASGRGASLGGRILRAADGGFRLEDVGLKVRGFRGQLERETESAP